MSPAEHVWAAPGLCVHSGYIQHPSSMHTSTTQDVVTDSFSDPGCTKKCTSVNQVIQYWSAFYPKYNQNCNKAKCFVANRLFGKGEMFTNNVTSEEKLLFVYFSLFKINLWKMGAKTKVLPIIFCSIYITPLHSGQDACPSLYFHTALFT